VTLKSTPAEDGFRMPGEFEPHSGCWMAWPERPDNWRLGAKPAQEAYAAVATAIAASEPVTMAVSDGQFENCRAQLPPEVRVIEVSTDDAWVRDHGPTFLASSHPPSLSPSPAPALVDWGYNAWGGKYPPFDLDDDVPRRIAGLQGRRRFVPGIILEGGAIDGNGEGCVLTTKSCLLNPNRNPQLSQADIEKYLDGVCRDPS